jgi:hypothetical protein
MEWIPDWSDDGRVYVDGRLTRNQARHVVCEETGGWYKTCTAHRCYVRLLIGDEAREVTSGEFDEFWQVCKKDMPGALSMWEVHAP